MRTFSQLTDPLINAVNYNYTCFIDVVNSQCVKCAHLAYFKADATKHHVTDLTTQVSLFTQISNW